MKILLLGKDGQVGWELQRALAPLGEMTAFGRQQANLEDLDQLRETVRRLQPDVIVNAAAYTAVDKAETDKEKAHRINAEAVGLLAREAKQCNAWLVHYSTDYVFDGSKLSPYEEGDQTGPVSVYGTTKLQGERSIQESGCAHLVFRTSWVYAARGANFPKTMLRLAKEREELKVIADQHGAPTSAELIADVTALALYRIQGDARHASALSGIYHLAASGDTTWHGYAQFILQYAQAKGISLKVKADSVQAIPTEAYPLPAARPKNSRLNTTKLINAFNVHLPDWRYHAQRLMDEVAAQGGS